MAPVDEEKIIKEMSTASKTWIANFNQGNVDQCVAAYQSNAVVNAKPLGTFKGHSEIENFWRPFMESGAGELVYKNVTLEIVDSSTVLLSADWSMNVGRGIITLEKWVKDTDGTWRLAQDDFEILQQF